MPATTQPGTPAAQSPPRERKRRGCFFYGCLGSILLAVIIVLGGYLGFRMAVNRFTDDHPLPLPKTQLSVEDLQRLRARVLDFTRAIDEGKPTGQLILTSEEANAFIQTEPQWAFLRDQVYVGFESNRLEAQVSIPAERLGSPRLRGRYLNASGSFTIALHNGRLQVNVLSLSSKGESVPEKVMQQLRGQNLAQTFTNAPSDDALRKIQSVEIKDGTLIIVPKLVKF